MLCLVAILRDVRLTVKELVTETTQAPPDPDLVEVRDQLVDDLRTTYGEENVISRDLYGTYDDVEHQITVIFPNGYTDEERVNVANVRETLASHMHMVVGTKPVNVGTKGNRVQTFVCGELEAYVYAYERTHNGNPMLRIILRGPRASIVEAKYADESYDDVKEVYEELLFFVRSETDVVDEEPDPFGRIGEFYAIPCEGFGLENVMEAAKSIVWLVTQKSVGVRSISPRGAEGYVIENEDIYVVVKLTTPMSGPAKLCVVVGENDGD